MPRSKVGKDLTTARGPVHGNFEEGSRITLGAMALFSGGSSWHTLTSGQKEAVHMIVHKLHRIVTGNSQHADHWNDIGGYAQLGSDACAGAAADTKAIARVRLGSAARQRPAKKRVAKKAAAKRTAKLQAQVRKAARKRPAKKRVRPARVRAPRPAVPAVAQAAE